MPGLVSSSVERFASRYLSATEPGKEDVRELRALAEARDASVSPYARGRVRHRLAEVLAASGRLDEARVHFAAAQSSFTASRALRWAERSRAAREDLVERPGVSEVALGYSTLTEQEERIVALAASGLSNKEIGKRLYLSPRTVGGHLYNAFPKLGIGSRAALRDALLRRDRSRGGLAESAS